MGGYRYFNDEYLFHKSKLATKKNSNKFFYSLKLKDLHIQLLQPLNLLKIHEELNWP